MLFLLQRLVRLVAFVFLALIGMFMAVVFVASTIVAVAILVVVARLERAAGPRGLPAGVLGPWDFHRHAGPRPRCGRRPGFRGRAVGRR